MRRLAELSLERCRRNLSTSRSGASPLFTRSSVRRFRSASPWLARNRCFDSVLDPKPCDMSIYGAKSDCIHAIVTNAIRLCVAFFTRRVRGKRIQTVFVTLQNGVQTVPYVDRVSERRLMVACSYNSDEIGSFCDLFSRKPVRKSSQRGDSRREG